MADLIVQSFNAGELTPLVDGRSDLEKYYSGVRIGDNMIPLPYGPAERRPGTYFAAECKNHDKKARLVSFQYSTEQAYIHEFGENYIRFYKDRGQIISMAGSENLGSVDGDCVGQWKMNDDAADANIVDSKNANTGTSQRDTDVLTTTGAANDALIFSGAYDYITIPDNANYDFAAAFTLAGWVNSDIAVPDAPRQILHRYDSTSEDGYRITLTTAGKLEFAVFVGGTETSIVSDSALSSGWHFFAATRDAAGVMKLYIDSILQEDTDTLAGAIDSTGDILLGIPSERDDLGSVDGDCVLYWKMDDNAASTDVVETKNARTGTAQQFTNLLDTTGVIDGALTFNGSTDYIEVADCAELDFAAAFSIALWVKPNRLGHTADQFVLSRYGGASNDGYYIFQTTTDKWVFGTLIDSGYGISVYSNSPATGDWQFLVGTRDAAGNMKLYVDGVLQTDIDVNIGAITTNSVLNIGRRSWNTDAYFDGTVDATMFFNTDLSLAEANELYAKGKKFAGKLDHILLFDRDLLQAEVDNLSSESTYEIGSPYLEADLFGLQHVQSADVLYNAHSDYAQSKLMRYAHDNWELENIVFDWPPFLSENDTDTTITPSATTGSITLTASAAIFTSNHVGSSWLIKHPRSDNKVEKQLTEVYSAAYAAAGITDILVDVKGSFRLRTSGVWGGTIELEQSYDKQLVLVLNAAPAGGAWSAGDVITGAAGETCIIVSVTDDKNYVIKQLSGSFTDGEVLTAQDANAYAGLATYPRYEGWFTLETFVSVQDQNFNAPGEETLGNAYLRAKRTVDDVGADPTVLITCERYYHYGIVKITGFTDSTHVTATVIRTIGPTNATKLWSEGAWSDERGYPVSSAFFEGRQFYAGTPYRPLNIWGSRVEDYENMEIGTLDDDPVQYTVDAAMQNMIRWLVAHEVLLIGTSGGEWRLGSVDPADAITPTNPMRPKQQTSYGSTEIQALLLANAVLFVSPDKKGRKVRGAQYIFEKGEAGGYDAPDYSELAEHITKSGIVEMAYQQNPYPILWCVRNDGVLIGMVFEPGQRVWGWFRCVIDGDVESVAVIPGVTEDEVWIIVKREINGETKRYIEYFKPRDWGDDQADCFFVDSGLTFDGGAAVTITGITKANPGVVTAANTFSDGDQVKIKGVAGMLDVNNKVFTVHSPAADTFSLRDKLDTVDWDTTDYDTFEDAIEGDTEYGSNIIKNVSAADIATLALGAPIIGTGIAAESNTTITEIGDDWFTISTEATKTNTAVSFTVQGTVEKVDNAFSGLDHLEGRTVAVLGDGSVHADVVVSSGSVTLTDYFNKVHIGLPYKSSLMPMKLAVPGANIRGKTKRIHQIIFSFYKTLGAKFGTTEGSDRIHFRKTTDPVGYAPPIFTGEKVQTFHGGYELNGDIYVEQTQPLPMTVRTIIAKLQVY